MAVERIISIGIFIACVVEESEELVIVFLAKWIVGMAMALHASKGCSDQGFPGGVHPIQRGGCSEFFILRSTLIIGHGVAMKGRGNILALDRIRQQISGQLLNQK